MQSRTYAKKEYGLAKTSRGFTLVEIIVVVGLVAILSAIALPNFNTFMAKRRVNAVVNQLAASVKLARSEAQAVGRNVSICATSDGLVCAGGNNWSLGWMVYVEGATPRIVKVYQLDLANLTVGLTGPAGGVMTIAPTGLGSPVNTVIRVLPDNVPATLGKTMTFQNVTLELSVTNGA